MNIVLIGMKHCGKSTFANELAKRFSYKILSLDVFMETIWSFAHKKQLSCREIMQEIGEENFRDFEGATLQILEKMDLKKTILDVGGGTPLTKENQKLLKRFGKIVYLDLEKKINLERILKHGVPAFFPYPHDPQKSFDELHAKRTPIYKSLSDHTISFSSETAEELVDLFTSLVTFL